MHGAAQVRAVLRRALTPAVTHVVLAVALSRVRTQSDEAHLTNFPYLRLHSGWRRVQMRFVNKLMSQASQVCACVTVCAPASHALFIHQRC